jgi:hypothetical protein
MIFTCKQRFTVNTRSIELIPNSDGHRNRKSDGMTIHVPDSQPVTCWESATASLKVNTEEQGK